MSTSVGSRTPTGAEPDEVSDALLEMLAADRPVPPTMTASSMRLAGRSLRKIRHNPEILADAVLLPVVFTLLFTYLFGGALAGSTDDYLQFLLPGTLVMAVLMIAGVVGVTFKTDIATGATDRFRSLPIWRPSYIVGGLLGEVLRNLLAAVIVIGLGLVMGFRAAGGVGGVVLALGLCLVFAFALSWVWATLGLVLRTPTTVSMLSFLVQFPLTFASNAFVDPATMPGWLRAFVDVNPVSILVTAVRGLVHGDPVAGEVAGVLIASGLLIAVFGPLTMRLYARIR